MAKHEPGPWEVVPVPRRSRQEIRAVDGPSIAEVYGYQDEDNVANAKLIAAAPDLLAACCDALAMLEREGSGFTATAQHTLRAAIAKAE